MINQAHFVEFERRAQADSGWKGSVPSAWVKALPAYVGGRVPDKHVDRNDLRTFCQSAENSSEACFVACMAWGGMRRSHGRDAFAERARWLPVMESLRGGGLSRTEAYRQFRDARVSGLAPAYFTKLIHFMRPERDGYVLDQWTAKSVGLLFEQRFITIRGGWVTRENDDRVYGRYCDAVEHLAERIGSTPDAAEELMFSKGGLKKQSWRQYVVGHWA